jgi:hypothetical protein
MPELVNTETNPTLRYPIARFLYRITDSYGWLEISREKVRYYVVQPLNKQDDGFEATRDLIAELKVESVPSVFLRVSGKKHRVLYLPQERWGTIQDNTWLFDCVASTGPTNLAIYQAIKDFDSALAALRFPPTVVLTAEPSTVERGRPVTLTWAAVNASTVELTPEIGKVQARGSRTVMPSESVTYQLTATGPGGTQSGNARVTVIAPPPAPGAAAPTILLVEPSVSTSGQALEVSNSPLAVRGMAMDSSGLPMVTINGSPANTKSRSPQAVEFWSDPVPLKPGENSFEIVATNAANVSAKFSFVARFTPKASTPISKALSKEDILDLLRSFVPSQRVAALVRERGVKFTPTANDLAEIRAASGQDDLINPLKHAANAANP